MDFVLKKKLDDKLYKTLHKVYNTEYENTGKLDNDDFNEYLVILVKSGLSQDEIKDLLRRTIKGEDNEFKNYLNSDLTSTNSVFDIVFLTFFGIIFTFFLIKLFI